MNKYIFCFLLIPFLFISGCGDDMEINSIEDFEEYLTDEMDNQEIPAMSVLIFREGEVLYEEYFGKSNLEDDIPLENDHLFLMASVSKVVTATALLQLEEEGLFELDDKINDYLSFNVISPSHPTTDITFRMLLTHTSGIEDSDALYDQYYYGEDSPTSLSFYIKNYLAVGGDYYDSSDNFYGFKPGTKHEYSNAGNALIGVLVEEISGIEFNLYCKENIFNPLNMSNTFWRLDEISQTIVTPYDFEDGEQVEYEHYSFTDYPNGALRTTAQDMFKFLSAFTQGGRSNDYQLLSQSTIDAMLTPQIPTIDNEVGLHLFLMDDDYSLWGHDGGDFGVATVMAFNPTTKTGAIIFTNQGYADLEEILAEAYKIGLTL
jgi:CubicO group peptidase (beta-lactamase class C family)